MSKKIVCLFDIVENDLWTYQDAVESRRGPSSLHVTQDCHSCVETQALDNKLGGHNEDLEDIVEIYLTFPLMVNNTPNWADGSLMCRAFSNTANSESMSTIIHT